jgi:hypothetical protein
MFCPFAFDGAADGTGETVHTLYFPVAALSEGFRLCGTAVVSIQQPLSISAFLALAL